MFCISYICSRTLTTLICDQQVCLLSCLCYWGLGSWWFICLQKLISLISQTLSLWKYLSFHLILAEWNNDCSIGCHCGSSHRKQNILRIKPIGLIDNLSEKICWLPLASSTALSFLLIVAGYNVFQESQDILLMYWNEMHPNIYLINNAKDDSYLYSDLSCEKHQKLSCHCASPKQSWSGSIFPSFPLLHSQ